MNRSNISILILSCDGYSDLWDNNVFLLNKYWPNHPPFTIITDKPTVMQNNNGNYNLEVIEKEQSNRIIEAAKNCDSDYILLSLDDYFINKTVKDEEINRIIKYLSDNNLQYCRLYKKTKLKKPIIDKNNGYRFLNHTSEVYEVNFYPGIWKKDALITVLVENETIWQAEVMLTKRFTDKHYKGIAIYDQSVFPFKDIVRKGKYLRSAYRFLKKEKLYISNRKKRSVSEEISLWLRTLLSEHMPYKIKKKLKRIRNKNYYSDYYDNSK